MRINEAERRADYRQGQMIQINYTDFTSLLHKISKQFRKKALQNIGSLSAETD